MASHSGYIDVLSELTVPGSHHLVLQSLFNSVDDFDDDVFDDVQSLTPTLRALNSVKSVREVVSLCHGFMFVS